MEVPFKNLLNRLGKLKEAASSVQNRTFIKPDKKFLTILGIVFAVSAIALFCYWFLIVGPSYERLLADKNELIKTLKFTRDKQKKIFENTVASYEEKLKNEYAPKAVYDDKIKEYEQKLDSYKNNYISKDEYNKQMQELEQRFGKVTKETYEQKIATLEQNISILEDKNLSQKTALEASSKFIMGEKDSLENLIALERKKALIPSLVLPETLNKTLNAEVLKKLVGIKSKLENIDEMNLVLKPDTYFEMGLVSYYNKQNEKAIEQWENTVSLNKNDLKAYVCLGIVYNEEDMYDNAVKILKRVLEINPKFSTTHLTLARIYEQNNMLDDAIYEYSKVLEINPETIEIHNTIGTLYEKNGMKEEAKKSFAQYEKLKKKNK